MEQIKRAVRLAIRKKETRDPYIIVPEVVLQLEKLGYEPYDLLEKNNINTKLLFQIIENIEIGGLKLKREDLGLSIYKLSIIAHLDTRTIKSIEQGLRKPHAESMKKLKTGLDKALHAEDIDQLLEEERKKRYAPERVEKGAELRSRRQKLGLIMEELMEISGIAISEISKAEYGDGSQRIQDILDRALTKVENERLSKTKEGVQ